MYTLLHSHYHQFSAAKTYILALCRPPVLKPLPVRVLLLAGVWMRGLEFVAHTRLGIYVGNVGLVKVGVEEIVQMCHITSLTPAIIT